MQVSFNTVSFTSNDAKEKRKDAEKKVVTGGGATAAAVATSRAKAAKSGFDVFASSKKVSQGLQIATNTGKSVTTVAKKSTTLWAKVCENAKWAKNAIINWGAGFKNMKYIKPIVTSKPFAIAAGTLGYGFGLVTLISGLSDITKVATDIAQGE